MEIWGKVCTPPSKALKEIKDGYLKGKSDISPMWRLQALTETFGPCGLGWKYVITNKWTQPGVNDSIMCFVDVELYVKYENEWSAAIPGTGGSMLINKFNSGLKNSDEGYKMALTDALSVAMKALGVAAQVYSGFDESKYHVYFGVENNDPKAILEKQKEAVRKWVKTDEQGVMGYLIDNGLDPKVDDNIPVIYNQLSSLKKQYKVGG